MFIKVDVREHDLIQSITFTLNSIPCFKGLVLVKEQLPLGDVIICDEKEEKVIIERKTLRDLSASIKDGRYEEQSYRLNGISHHNHNIVYLIEGSIDKMNIFKGQNDKMMLYSSMVSLNFFKGFSVMRSMTVEESALMICNFAYKVSKGLSESKKPYYNNSMSSCFRTKLTSDQIVESNELTNAKEEIELKEITNSKEENELKEEKGKEEEIDLANAKDYCTVVKKIKKDNVTPENIGEIILCQIPSISSVTAIAIMAQFNTLPNLISSLQKDPSCMQNISYKTSTGQSRKISKTCIANILTYLSK